MAQRQLLPASSEKGASRRHVERPCHRASVLLDTVVEDLHCTLLSNNRSDNRVRRITSQLRLSLSPTFSTLFNKTKPWHVHPRSTAGPPATGPPPPPPPLLPTRIRSSSLSTSFRPATPRLATEAAAARRDIISMPTA